MDTIEKVMQAIRYREEVEITKVSVDKMLSINGMGEYKKQCKRRCKPYIDNLHVVENLLGDIVVDVEGFYTISSVLCGYLDIEAVRYYEVNLEGETKAIKAYNEAIKAMRDMSVPELKAYLRKTNPEETGSLFAVCEIESRKISNRIDAFFRKIRIKTNNVAVKGMNYILRFALGVPLKGDLQL